MYSAQKCTKMNNMDMKRETPGVCKHTNGGSHSRNEAEWKVFLGKESLI